MPCEPAGVAACARAGAAARVGLVFAAGPGDVWGVLGASCERIAEGGGGGMSSCRASARTSLVVVVPGDVEPPAAVVAPVDVEPDDSTAAGVSAVSSSEDDALNANAPAATMPTATTSPT